MNENIIGELNQKIMALDQTINELRNQLGKETSELNGLNNEYLALKSQYDLKKMELSNEEKQHSFQPLLIINNLKNKKSKNSNSKKTPIY